MSPMHIMTIHQAKEKEYYAQVGPYVSNRKAKVFMYLICITIDITVDTVRSKMLLSQSH